MKNNLLNVTLIEEGKVKDADVKLSLKTEGEPGLDDLLVSINSQEEMENYITLFEEFIQRS